MLKSRIASSVSVLLVMSLYAAVVCTLKMPLNSADWMLLGGVIVMLVLLGLRLLTSGRGTVDAVFRPLQNGICLGFATVHMIINSILFCLPELAVRTVAIYEGVFYLLFVLTFTFLMSAQSKARQQERQDTEQLMKIHLLENELRAMAQSTDISVRKFLTQLADVVHECDAITHPQLEQLDESIEQSIFRLHSLLEQKMNQEAIAAETHNLATLLAERNSMAAILRRQPTHFAR